MMHDPDTLASAYLDGELTDEDRRAAEADPAVMAEVERLRAVRVELGAVEPPSDTARESAIGAAMAAYHERFGGAAATHDEQVDEHDEAQDDVVVPFVRRIASPQWLGVAAAAVVLVVAVGVVGTVATRGADDQDDGDFATAEVMEDAAEEPAEEPADEPLDLPDAADDRIAESEMADDVFSTQAGDEADEDTALEMAEEPASEPAAGGEEPAEEAADEPASDDMGGADDGAGFDEVPPLDDPSLHFEDDLAIVGPLQLRSAAWYLLDQRDAGELGPTPEYRCEFYNVLGVALFDVDGERREILLEVDEVNRIVYAVEREGCLVLTAVDLDEP
ncbi:MAG: hypothetical protein CL424_11760 [Acidimicrobiaceae bacterium]|nr:hypothetical protein [Acidimicrobiaceae bacterium]